MRMKGIDGGDFGHSKLNLSPYCQLQKSDYNQNSVFLFTVDTPRMTLAKETLLKRLSVYTRKDKMRTEIVRLNFSCESVCGLEG